MLDLKATFEKYEDEFLKFNRIENPRHPAPDLCCFLMLDDLAPKVCSSTHPDYAGQREDVVAAAEHDEIFLATDPEKIAEVATEEQVRDMIRCGLQFSSEYDSFCMFV
jgi:hypothetical protein